MDLPGVGYHWQDQIRSILIFNATGNNDITDDLTNKPTYAFVNSQKLFGNDTMSIQAELRRSIPNHAAKIAVESHGTTTTHTEMQHLSARMKLIYNKNVPIAELVLNPSFVSLWLTLPFSIGSVHVRSLTDNRTYFTLLIHYSCRLTTFRDL